MCLAQYQPIKPIHVVNTIILELLTPFLNLFSFPLCHQNPLQTFTFHWCWMEGCNLARTCPSNCIFLFLCFLAIFYYRDVIFKPNPLYPKKWALNLALKLLWNHSLTTLSVVTNNAVLTLALLSFSTFLQIVSFDGVNVCSTCLDPFSFLYFIFCSMILLAIFFSNVFISTLLNIGLMWPHVN